MGGRLRENKGMCGCGCKNAAKLECLGVLLTDKNASKMLRIRKLSDLPPLSVKGPELALIDLQPQEKRR
jgi:hypothetical protein